MRSLVVNYDSGNVIAKGLLDVLSKINGVVIYEDEDIELLTPDEMKRVEKSRKSGIHTDISILKSMLKSKI